MDQIKESLHSLTRAVCGQFDGAEIPKRSVWTVVTRTDSAPHVALDVDRPALSDIRISLSIGLLQMPEYGAAAEAIENDPELKKGIVIDAGGFLHEPEPTNLTRSLLTNFLWRYLREGNQLDWDESRFDQTFNELKTELGGKSVVFHTTLPLSNLKVEVDGLDFGGDLKLLPASIEELERWISPDWSLPPLGAGPPRWDTHYVDRPGVLHTRQVVLGRPPPADLHEGLGQLPRVNADNAITALRLVLNAPITVILQEHDSEGFMAFGGGGTSWGWSPPTLGPLAILDQEKVTQVIDVWQLLQTSPNVDRLRLPLRRWESSLLRTSHEDKLIDAWISFESLLLGGLRGELSYRASVRLAEFLGSSGIERETIYGTAKNSYDWRSAIVHGGSSKKIAKRQPLQEAVELTTEYLRLALLKVLKLPDRFDPNKLESELLGRESPVQ